MKLNSIEEMVKFAEYAVKAGIRSTKDKPFTIEQAVCVLQYGDELGIGPMAALKGITYKGTMPTVDGDLALALARKSGLCDYIEESFEKGKATCVAKRKDQDKTITRTFTMAEAEKAKLTSRFGPWQQFPDRMLRYRALGFCLRDAFPEVMSGLHITQEIEEDEPIPAPHCDTPKRADRVPADMKQENQSYTGEDDPTMTAEFQPEPETPLSPAPQEAPPAEPAPPQSGAGTLEKALIGGVKKMFIEALAKAGVVKDKKELPDLFMVYSAYTLACSLDDVDADIKFNKDMLLAIKKKLDGGIDADTLKAIGAVQ